jgi:hypothetical protein
MSEDQKSARDLELEQKQAEADKANAAKTGVGTRTRVGQTRGKNPIVITWDAFDESKPETLPTTFEAFMEVTGIKEEPTLVDFLITGYNDQQYTAASDPLAEFVEENWPAEAKTQFRLVVRNYARGANVSLEDAVALIKPGFSKQFAPSEQSV